ncbi:hypothetical protein KR093_006458, partial [Drosophila rubida]
PLLQYTKQAQQREQTFSELTKTIHEKEIIIAKLREVQVGLEVKVKAQQEIIASTNKQLKLHENNNMLQKELLASQKKQIETALASKCPNANSVIESNGSKAAQGQEAESNVTSCLANKTGIQKMSIHYVDTFPAYCDSELAGAGWTVIQRRKDASENFNRSWTDYRKGFGQVDSNYFIGLEKLHRLTNEKPHELYIYMKSAKNEIRTARYSLFKIADESDNYKLLSVGKYSAGLAADAGDSFSWHIGMKFSTYDRDNDVSVYNCALEWLSGWWFNSCYHSNLNGLYKDGVKNLQSGIKWNSWDGVESITFVQMMIRPTAN